jgi:hypothetical protein
MLCGVWKVSIVLVLSVSEGCEQKMLQKQLRTAEEQHSRLGAQLQQMELSSQVHTQSGRFLAVRCVGAESDSEQMLREEHDKEKESFQKKEAQLQARLSAAEKESAKLREEKRKVEAERLVRACSSQTMSGSGSRSGLTRRLGRFCGRNSTQKSKSCSPTLIVGNWPLSRRWEIDRCARESVQRPNEDNGTDARAGSCARESATEQLEQGGPLEVLTGPS